MAAIHDEAFCIRVWDWSETSQTVSLFCRSHGVVRGLAKGAKRDDARFSGGFELLTRGQIGMIVKSSDAMATLTSWDLTRAFPGARSSLGAFYTAMALLDLVHHMVHDHDPHSALFDALTRSAEALGSSEPTVQILAGFLWSVLVETGYRPELERDVRTSLPLDAGAPLAFDAKLGGFTRWSNDASEAAWRARPQTLDLLRRLAGGSPPAGAPEDFLRAGKLLYAYVRETAGAPVPSVERALQVLAD
ncbi:MAG: DNA repair protein RecO [Phycisphaeraceae bacterium]|nr:DNA repair protein RecO [Phycisphaeraceae bacterium]